MYVCMSLCLHECVYVCLCVFWPGLGSHWGWGGRRISRANSEYQRARPVLLSGCPAHTPWRTYPAFQTGLGVDCSESTTALYCTERRMLPTSPPHLVPEWDRDVEIKGLAHPLWVSTDLSPLVLFHCAFAVLHRRRWGKSTRCLVVGVWLWVRSSHCSKPSPGRVSWHKDSPSKACYAFVIFLALLEVRILPVLLRLDTFRSILSQDKHDVLGRSSSTSSR